jgi:hypothetical protein
LTSEYNSEQLNSEISKWIKSLMHPQESSIQWIREIIMNCGYPTEEKIKWNSPNFTVNGEDRITLRIQPVNCFQIILHLGAKKSLRDLATEFSTLSPLIEWKSGDRGIITLSNKSDIKNIEAEINKILSKWLNVV